MATDDLTQAELDDLAAKADKALPFGFQAMRVPTFNGMEKIVIESLPYATIPPETVRKMANEIKYLREKVARLDDARRNKRAD